MTATFNPAPSRAPAARRLQLSTTIASNDDPQSRSGKRLLVKTLPVSAQSASQSTEGFAQQALGVFVRSIRAITSDPSVATPESLQTLYSLCEGYLSAHSGDSSVQAGLLYDKIRLELEKSVVSIKRRLLNLIEQQSSQCAATDEDIYQAKFSWLAALKDRWIIFTARLSMIRSIFLPLDRDYIFNTKGLLPIWDLGFELFRSTIIEDELLSEEITSSLLLLIRHERSGHQISRSIFTTVLSILHALGSSTFDERFVKPFLADSQRWYSAEGERLASSSSTATSASYLKQCQARLEQERSRCQEAMAIQPSLLRSCEHAVESGLVREHVDYILNGLSEYIEAAQGTSANQAQIDLQSLYNLLGRVDAIQRLRAAWSSYIENQGVKLVADPAKDDTMVDSLLSFKDRVDWVLSDCFGNDQMLAVAARDAFESFVNKRNDKPAELLAKYLDIKMRTGNKALSDAELTSLFDKVLVLFRFTSAKDLFEAFYTRLFAKRLLLNKSASSDMEKIMLGKLREGMP